jgi:hypothetical protein
VAAHEKNVLLPFAARPPHEAHDNVDVTSVLSRMPLQAARGRSRVGAVETQGLHLNCEQPTGVVRSASNAYLKDDAPGTKAGEVLVENGSLDGSLAIPCYPTCAESNRCLWSRSRMALGLAAEK